jgi:GAF domain-containing protein
MSDDLNPVEARAQRFLASMEVVGRRSTVQFLPAAMGLLAVGIAAFVGLYAWTEPAWQWLAMVAAYIQVLILFVIAYVLIHRERFNAAALTIVIGVNVAAVMGAMTLEGWLPISVTMGFAAVILGTAIAGGESHSAFIILTGFGFVLDTWLADIDVVSKLAPPAWVRSGFWVIYAMVALTVTGVFLSYRTGRFEQALARIQEILEELRGRRTRYEMRAVRWERHRHNLDAIAKLVRLICTRLDPETLFHEIVVQVSEVLNAYHVVLYLVDSPGQRATIKAATGKRGRVLLAEGHEVPIRELGAVGDVLVRGQSRLVQKGQGQSGVTGILNKLPDTRSAISVPLRGRNDRVLGALELHSRDRMTEDNVTVVDILADALAASIGNARILDRLQESLESERQAGGAATQQAWQEWIRSSATKGYRYEASEVVPLNVSGDSDSDQGKDSGGLVADDGNRLYETALSLTTARGYPLGRVVAHKENSWTDDDIALMQSLMEQVEQTLENARLYQNTQRRALREQLSRQITDRIRSAATVEEAMRRALATLAEVTEAREMVAVIRPERPDKPEDSDEGEGPYAG